MGEGARRFGQAVGAPLARASRTLWLEVTGLFFALFAVFFGQSAWKTRASAVRGPEHDHFLLYLCASLIFLYFCASSFLRARRRARGSGAATR